MEELLRWLHVIGACVLLGTGAGIAFFMLVSHQSKNPALIAHVASIVVLADFVFTATAALLQPITGWLLALQVGWSLSDLWLSISIALYVLIGVFWLPVIAIQMKMRDLARTAAAKNQNLPHTYFRLYRIWLLCGIPAFISILAILWLMLAKPVF